VSLATFACIVKHMFSDMFEAFDAKESWQDDSRSDSTTASSSRECARRRPSFAAAISLSSEGRGAAGALLHEADEASKTGVPASKQANSASVAEPWEVAENAVEDAMEGFVAMATEVAGSVAGVVAAVGGAAAIALGESSSVAADAVRALGEVAGLANQGADGAQGMPAVGNPRERCMAEQDEDGEDTRTQRSPRRRASVARVPCKIPTATADARRLAVLTNGSEGDIRPLIALCKTLMNERGFAVRVLTNSNLVHTCLRHGVDAVPVFADSKEIIHNIGGMRGDLVEAIRRPAKAAENWLTEHAGEYVAVQDALDSFSPHALIAGNQVLGLCIRYERASGAVAIPVYLSRDVVEHSGLNILAESNPPRPSFYPVSEVVDRKAAPSSRTLKTAAWALHEAPQVADLAPGGSLHELRNFLDAGPPPVAVGWGSMLAEGMTPAEMLELALRALMHVGRRGVIIGGWAELDRMASVAAAGRFPSRVSDGGKLAEFVKDNVCFVPFAPHEWLFPRCCCIVHHGGIGTLHAALRAGRPSVATPVCADQFFAADMLRTQHGGVGFTKALPEIRYKELAQAITAATSDAMSLATQALGRRIQREEGRGTSQAAEIIDGYLKGKVRLGKEGRWIKRAPAKKVPSREAA